MTYPSSRDARIACPRCGANNFAGTVQCWQCSAPLPPPEAVGAARGSLVPGPSSRPAGQPQPAGPSPGPTGKPGPGANPRADLPSPHYAAAMPASAPLTAADNAFVRKWGMSRGVAAALAAVALGMFLVVWFISGRMRGGTEPLRAAPKEPAPVFAPATQETSAARPAADEDPLVAESKRFIERESRHAGLPEPPAASDGRVYLRGGGSISTEQYRDAQRHVQESPVMHTPIPPPPVP